jgi:hypothetical protein
VEQLVSAALCPDSDRLQPEREARNDPLLNGIWSSVSAPKLYRYGVAGVSINRR